MLPFDAAFTLSRQNLMWFVWSTSFVCFAALVGSYLLIRRDATGAPRAWQALAASGIPLSLGGLGFVLRFWEPQPGPYKANEVYPLGPYLNAWAVSFGFMWLSFGIAFCALALLAQPSRRLWILLFIAWVLAWLPHGIIGVGFLWAGSNEPSVALYRSWGSNSRGFLHLLSGAFVLLAHFALAIGGFVFTGRALWRGASEMAPSA